MQTLVIYDVPSNKLRNKIADVCLDYALERIQLSAFLGDMTANRCEELLLKIKRHMGNKEGNVQIFPVCEKCLKHRKQLINKKDDDSLPKSKTRRAKSNE
ncbi:MAG: CRISPR-associated endonuclease Cas2 [Armatimonadota bacterium]|nr:CRISPR-associated endonuclease Cas2 [Armatimonadota bacterium]